MLLKKIFDRLNINEYIVDFVRDNIFIMEQYLIVERENNIISFNSNLEKEWYNEKKGKIKPEYVPRGSNHKFL